MNNIRNNIIYGILCIFFIILSLRTLYLTTIKGNQYSNVANQKIYRQISIDTPRGEIRDRYGNLLAGNREMFSIELYPQNLKNEDMNKNIQKLITIIEGENEKIIDEFPIIIKNGEFVYKFDESVKEWKLQNNIPLEFKAEESFNYIVDILVENGSIVITDKDTNLDIQTKIIEAGYYPPISVAKNEYREIVRKNEWLLKYLTKKYSDDEKKLLSLTAKQAFQDFREHYKIPSELSDEDARKIINIRYLISEKGYYQYEPTLIAEDIKNTTVAKIEENSINLTGVNIKSSSIRYYPNGNHAAHILGQLGKISSTEDIDYYVKEKGYSLNDIIGKTGIEKAFEEDLRGKKGFVQVQIDSNGKLIDTIKRETSKTGKTIYLTIDSKLQEIAEQSLEKTLKTIQNGGTYDSVWGGIRMRDNRRIYNKATSGAVVVLDVKTGDVLAMASYPDYDPNLFVKGISNEEFQKLSPQNLNDTLSPKPLYNVATMTTVQPGSIFKIVTGLTGIELGLSPYYEINDKGFIKMGSNIFGCWLWNQSGGSHGPENLMDALRDSCNYYFYSVSTGYDYSKEKKLPINIKAKDILDYASRFGLNEKSGIEIEELSGKVPSVEAKLISKKSELKSVLLRKMKNYFDIENISTEMYNENIEEIVSWMEENPTRNEIIKRLTNLKVKEEYVEEITDLVKYSYYNQGKWQTGDSFNMSIGQGDHKYSPIQIARYVSAIANNGYLNQIKLVKEIETSDKENKVVVKDNTKKIELNNLNNLSYLRKGMEDVTDEGTSSYYFRNFPIKVASKTGTAQKSGSIPSADEEKYLLDHLSYFGVNREKVVSLTNKLQKEDGNKLKRNVYMLRAILELNPRLTLERINQFKEKYDPFAWFVSYAPADKPEVVVVTLIFQGGHGGYGAAIARDVYAEYFNLIELNNNGENFTFNNKVG